jgi:hypothetical protein
MIWRAAVGLGLDWGNSGKNVSSIPRKVSGSCGELFGRVVSERDEAALALRISEACLVYGASGADPDFRIT